jgi:release factor glutamine methyltransferase
MSPTYTLSDIVSEYRLELDNIYPHNEIRNIGYLVSEHLLNYSKIDFHLKYQEPISAEMVEKFRHSLERLKQGEPVQYITGGTEFYGLPFRVDRRVLIPRPETEELVEWIIRENRDLPVRILDIGTGSGCIAVSLAVNLSGAGISACDVSEEALNLAVSNAETNRASIRFFAFNLLDQMAVLPEKYEVIVSNPPYVREGERVHMSRNVLDYEPELALFVPDADPLLYCRSLALLGRKYLQDGGKLYLEINENFPAEVVRLLENAGFYGIEVRKDLNGKARMIRARK